jgi:hypothetical protein
VAKLALGFGTGLFLASPYILPVMEYSRESSRMALRVSGKEERRPVGLAALPQVILPDMYGSLTQNCGFRISQGNELETSAGAYAGVIAALVLVPLAWSSPRRIHENIFWSILALIGLSWCLNVPGLVQLLRLPGLNMMSHNRLVFASSFAILTMAVLGLETLWNEEIRWSKALWFPALVLGGLCVWCLSRAFDLPESVTTELEQLIKQGGQIGWTHDLAGVQRIQIWFVDHYTVAAGLCAAGVIGWLALYRGWIPQKRFLFVAGGMMVADLVWFSHGRAPQCDPALYCPRIPVLEETARAAGYGRVIGFDCLPANIASIAGLRDIRGYDGIDPRRIVELVKIAIDDPSPGYDYAATQSISPPKIAITPQGGPQLSPLLNMLGVRYVIFRKNPPKWPPPAFQGVDYWALENRAALPRAFVPQRVEVITEDKSRLEKLRAKNFDPRDVAYVEEPVDLGTSCKGVAKFRSEVPSHLTLELEMETPGLVVLADQWNSGWRAFVDGKKLPILRVNHALRGVVVPAGPHSLEFGYQPASFVRGLWLCALGAAAIIGWLACGFRRRLR